MMHFVAKSKTSMEVNGWENNEAILRGGGKLVENVGEARLAIRPAAKLAFSDKYDTVGNLIQLSQRELGLFSANLVENYTILAENRVILDYLNVNLE